MKLLLHTCCAPCLIYPLERLKENGFEVSGLFYNPNIHPFSEYKNRKQAVEDYSQAVGLKMFYPDYQPQEFFRVINTMEEKPQRCPICWYQRLKTTAKFAKENGFTYFSSTLLVSPYQDIGSLKRIGCDIANDEKLEFYYEDFRPGFRESHNKAKAQGIYCQNYCGCIYSEIERFKKKGQSPLGMSPCQIRCKKSAKH